jgi:hypothetical protein
MAAGAARIISTVMNLLLAAIVGAVTFVCAAAQTPESAVVVVRAARLIDGSGRPPIAPAVVIVRASVSSRSAAACRFPPARASSISAAQRSCLGCSICTGT